MTISRPMLALTISTLLFTACRKEDDCISGITTTEQRTVPAFTAVRVEGPIQADIRYGAAHHVAVTADHGIQPHIRTLVSGQTLVLSLEPANIHPDPRITITVDMPSIHRLTHNGVSDTHLSGFYGLPQLDVINNGVGTLTLQGSAGRLLVTQHGVGRVNAQQLAADTCQVGLSGVGHIDVRVAHLLRGYLTGVGNIYYRGMPLVDVTDTGVGNVIRVE